MGLDLTLYKRSDWADVEMNRKPWNESMELAYGRKTWGIANFLASRSTPLYDSDYVFIVPQNAWEDFYNTMSPVAEQLQTYTTKMFEIENSPIYTPEEADIAQENYDQLLYKVEQVLKDTLEESFFQLGADWEARTILQWLEANDKIEQIYADGEDIVMVQSY